MYEQVEIVGWREWALLPEFSASVVACTIDSSARSSSLKVLDFKIVGRGTERMAHVRFAPDRDAVTPIKLACIGPSIRPVVRTVVMIGRQRWPVELTLIIGHDYDAPLRLGRDAMVGRLLIDPLRAEIQGLPGWDQPGRAAITRSGHSLRTGV